MSNLENCGWISSQQLNNVPENLVQKPCILISPESLVQGIINNGIKSLTVISDIHYSAVFDNQDLEETLWERERHIPESNKVRFKPQSTASYQRSTQHGAHALSACLSATDLQWSGRTGC